MTRAHRTAALVFVALAASVPAGVPPARAEGPVPDLPPFPAPVSSFDVQARLDPATHRVEASGALRWRNAGPGPVSSLWLHLYLNAFKNDLSTFLREGRGDRSGRKFDRDDGWGWIDLLEAKLPDGRDLLPGRTFEAPDDGNPDDRTVMRLPLPAPLEEGESLEVRLKWTVQLPRVFARSGWHHDFHMVAQWFPKPGVRRPRDPSPAADRAAREGWTCRQYHANSEFFADFGDYRVSIVAPADTVVAATGRETSTADGPEGTRVHTFEQRGVIDFAWAASPRFRVVRNTWRYQDDPDPLEERRLAQAFRIPVEKVRPAGSVDVLLCLQPEHVDQAERYARAAAAALRLYGLRYGAYPYETLTVVDPPFGAGGAGGMEYPTFFTAGTGLFPHPDAWSPELVTVHEAGHQWFAMMVATNEAEQAWLDEGLNTYATARALETMRPGEWMETTEVAGVAVDGVPVGGFPGVLGAAGALLGVGERWQVPGNPLLDALRDAPPVSFVRRVRRDPFLSMRERWVASTGLDPADRPSWTFFDRASYRAQTYNHTALALRTLERLLGPDTLDRALRIHAVRHRFRHPTADEFLRTVAETAGRSDVPEILERLFRRPSGWDDSVAEVLSEPITRGRGMFDAPGGGKRLRAPGVKDGDAAGPGEAKRWRIEVALRRRGEGALPAEARVRFADGSEQILPPWSGPGPWTRMRITADAEPVEVLLDPDRRILVETDRGNDSWRKTPDRAPAWRWGGRTLRWAEGLLFGEATLP